MAEEHKELFTIDASEILAKLHLAGIMNARHGNDSFFVNTGIKNDDTEATPDNPKDVKFDLNGNISTFEVGYVKQITFTSMLSGEEDELNPLMTALSVISTMSSFLSQTQEKNNNSPIVNKDTSKSTTQKNDNDFSDKFEDLKKQLEKVKSENGDALSSNKEISKIVDDVLKLKDAISFSEMNSDDFKKRLEDENKKLKKSGSKKNDYDIKADEARTEAIEHLKKYFEAFSGKNSINKDIENPKTIVISDSIKSSSDKLLVSDYEILPIGETEASKKKELIMASIGKDFTLKICFKVKYTIDIDK